MPDELAGPICLFAEQVAPPMMFRGEDIGFGYQGSDTGTDAKIVGCNGTGSREWERSGYGTFCGITINGTASGKTTKRKETFQTTVQNYGCVCTSENKYFSAEQTLEGELTIQREVGRASPSYYIDKVAQFFPRWIRTWILDNGIVRCLDETGNITASVGGGGNGRGSTTVVQEGNSPACTTTSYSGGIVGHVTASGAISTTCKTGTVISGTPWFWPSIDLQVSGDAKLNPTITRTKTCTQDCWSYGGKASFSFGGLIAIRFAGWYGGAAGAIECSLNMAYDTCSGMQWPEFDPFKSCQRKGYIPRR
jgi:hypothetical protein